MMMRYLLAVVSVLVLNNIAQGQKEDYVWFLGIDQSADPGVQGMMWDWNKDNPVPVPHELALGIDNNNMSICDKDGNLLFWSNGCAVINRNQEVMPHGDTLNWDTYREVVGWKDCIRGYPGANNTKIIPAPGQDFGYFIFHKTLKYNGQFEDITYELRHSYVDLRLDDGLGDVVYSDSVMYDGRVMYSNIEVVKGLFDSTWWLLQPVENDSFMLCYLVGEEGIVQHPNINTSINFARSRSGSGTMRFSPDGTKLAYYAYFQNLHVYDFDRSTGQISNHQEVTIFDDVEDKPNSAFRFGSVEWSPNSRFMYVAVSDSLFQVDSWEEDMEDGIRLIDVWNGTLDPFPTTFYIASLAPDCKIYICSTSGSRSYHIIHQPDELGTDCDFVQNGLKLPQSAGSANLPLHPRWRVDEEDKCDPTITSVFGNAVWYRRDLQAYPSPTDGPLTVALPDDVRGGQLVVIDLQGRVILEQIIDHNMSTLQLDLSDYPAGHYHVEVYPEGSGERVYYGTQVVVVR